MNNTEQKLHWWLVSYVYFPKNGGQGFGNYTQGTDSHTFGYSQLEYARNRSSELVDAKTALTSVSYLGEMTKEIALGDSE